MWRPKALNVDIHAQRYFCGELNPRFYRRFFTLEKTRLTLTRTKFHSLPSFLPRKRENPSLTARYYEEEEILYEAALNRLFFG